MHSEHTCVTSVSFVTSASLRVGPVRRYTLTVTHWLADSYHYKLLMGLDSEVLVLVMKLSKHISTPPCPIRLKGASFSLFLSVERCQIWPAYDALAWLSCW